MVDVSKVQGPSGPTDPSSGKKEVSRADAEKFKKMMEVGETDPEGKGKKRERQQAAEEEKAKAALGGKSPLKELSPAELQRFAKTPTIKRPGEADKRQKKEQKRPEEVNAEIKRTQVAKETKIQAQKKEAEKQEIVREAAVAPLPPPTPAAPQSEEKKIAIKAAETKPRETPKAPAAMPLPPPPLIPPSTPLFLAPTTSASLLFEDAEVQQMFERLGLAMTVMQEGGITETTVHLSPQEFPHLAGTEIIIRQYSAAPLIFNIEFVGQNLGLIEQNIGQLMNAFQSGQFNFKVHRIETSQRTEERRKVNRKKEPNL